MEPIRLNINLQYGNQGKMSFLSMPVDTDGWGDSIADCRTPMRNLGLERGRAYQLNVYPDRHSVHYSLIIPNMMDYRGGFLQFTLMLNLSKVKADPQTILQVLEKMVADFNQIYTQKREQNIASTDPNRILQEMRSPMADSLTTLLNYLRSKVTQGNQSLVLKYPQANYDRTPVFYKSYADVRELSNIIAFPDQSYFLQTPSLMLISAAEKSAIPQQNLNYLVEVSGQVMRKFSVVNAAGHTYGEVTEGSAGNVMLASSPGYLPQQIDVFKSISAKDGVCVFNSQNNTILVDESKILFYKNYKICFSDGGKNIIGGTLKINDAQCRQQEDGSFVFKVPKGEENKSIQLVYQNNKYESYRQNLQLSSIRNGVHRVVLRPVVQKTPFVFHFGDYSYLFEKDLKKTERINYMLEEENLHGYEVQRLNSQYHVYIPETSLMKKLVQALIAWAVISLVLGALYMGIAKLFSLRPFEDSGIFFSDYEEYVEEEQGTPPDENIEEIPEAEKDSLIKLDEAYMKKSDSWARDSLKSEHYQKMFDAFTDGNIRTLLQDTTYRVYSESERANGYWKKIYEDLAKVDTPKLRECIERHAIDNTINLSEILTEMQKMAGAGQQDNRHKSDVRSDERKITSPVPHQQIEDNSRNTGSSVNSRHEQTKEEKMEERYNKLHQSSVNTSHREQSSINGGAKQDNKNGQNGNGSNMPANTHQPPSSPTKPDASVSHEGNVQAPSTPNKNNPE